MGDTFTMPDGSTMKSKAARELAEKARRTLNAGSYQRARKAYNQAIRAERAARAA